MEGKMPTTAFSVLMVVFGMLLSSCESRRCYRCNGESSLDKCDLQTCDAGPECYLSVSTDRHGQLSYNGACTDPQTCTGSSSSNYRRDPNRLCGGCCYTDLCVPDSCTQYVSYKLDKGVTCEQCSGGDCGVYPGTGPEWQCESEMPYCLNIVRNNADGNKHVTKGCGSQADCDALWWDVSRGRRACTDFDPSRIYTSNFTCSYCCLTEHCNRDIVPRGETLYMN